VLRALQSVVSDGHAENKTVGICGELAGDPGAAILLMAMGYDVLSMNATNLPKVKSVLRSISTRQAQDILAEAMQLESSRDIQELLEDKLNQTGVKRILRPIIG
jgi:phosphotransferase system enzyme I (PtsP)